MNESQDTGAEAATEIVSAGERLKRGREQAGWTLERLAGELCLPADRLRALEADEFAGFGGAVFVRGYLRRAAAVLGLPPEAVIASYEAASGTARPADVLPALPPGRPPRRGMPEWTGTAATAAVIACAIALTWWFMKPADAPEPLAEAPSATIDEARLELPQAEPGPEPDPALQSVAAGESVVEEAAPEASAPDSLAAAASADEPALQLPAAEDGPVAGAGTLELPVTVELRLEFAEDCWVEINDARGTRLAYRLYRAGDVSRLRGVAPVEVFLGNAEGVRLTVDDTPVAVRPAAGRDGTARLMVGGGTG